MTLFPWEAFIDIVLKHGGFAVEFLECFEAQNLGLLETLVLRDSHSVLRIQNLCTVSLPKKWVLWKRCGGHITITLSTHSYPALFNLSSSPKSCFIKRKAGSQSKGIPATWTLLNSGGKSRKTQITSVKGLYILYYAFIFESLKYFWTNFGSRFRFFFHLISVMGIQ